MGLKVETTRFGTLTLSNEQVIQMPYGMLGFPEQKRYVILEHRENSPFLWYQSIDDPPLAFVITNPLLFKPDYSVDVESVLEEMSWIQEGKEDHVELYVVVNIPKGAPEKMTANLVGPVLINMRARQAVQVVLPESSYSHRHPLLERD